MAQTLPSIVSGEGGLSRYLEEIRRFPMLQPQEEYMLAKRYQEHEDTRCGPQARDQPSASRGQDRHGLSRLWPADRRSHLRRQCRPHAGREEIRTGARLPPGHLCHVVDQGLDPGIHPALVEPGEDGNHRQPEAAVLQPAQGEGQDPGARRWRPEARAGHRDRHPAERQRGRGGVDEPPPVGRRFAQRADPRDRRRIRRVAGLAGRRPRQPGRDADRAGRTGKPPRACSPRPCRCSTTASAASSRRAASPTSR